MRLTLLFLLCLQCSAAYAEVYRCAKEGRITYTDKPCKLGAKPADLPEINFVGTPPPSKGEKKMARDWDQRIEKGRKDRAKADTAWMKEHDEKRETEARVQSGLSQRKVVKGMSQDQVRELLGEPTATSLQEGRENIMIWSYKPDEGPQYTVSFRGGVVNSVSSRKAKKKS